jgi:hypothetical protein
LHRERQNSRCKSTHYFQGIKPFESACFG